MISKSSLLTCAQRSLNSSLKLGGNSSEAVAASKSQCLFVSWCSECSHLFNCCQRKKCWRASSTSVSMILIGELANMGQTRPNWIPKPILCVCLRVGAVYAWSKVLVFWTPSRCGHSSGKNRQALFQQIEPISTTAALMINPNTASLFPSVERK